MRRITTATLLTGLIILAGCGGGGGSSNNVNANNDSGITSTINGSFSGISGSITPDPATTSQNLLVQITNSFVGQVSPQASTFTIPYTVARDGVSGYATGTLTYTLTVGSAGNGTFAGSSSLTLAPQSAGNHQFTITLTPGANYSFNGAIPTPASASVVVM